MTLGRILAGAGLLLIAGLGTGLWAWAYHEDPRPQVQLYAPARLAPTQHWRLVPMSEGPALWVACVGQDRLYAIGPQGHFRLLAVAPGGCAAGGR